MLVCFTCWCPLLEMCRPVLVAVVVPPLTKGVDDGNSDNDKSFEL